MSRSRKKTPGYFAISSDRHFEKRNYNKRWRRKNKVLVHIGSDSLVDKHDEIADPWSMKRDGNYIKDTSRDYYYRK